MKKLIALLTGSACIAGAASAQVTLEDLEISTTFAWESEYVFRGVKFAQGSFQPGLDLALGDLYVGTWGSFSTEDAYNDADEIDFFGGYGIAIDETFSLDLGVTVYYFPPSDSNTTEIYAGIAADTEGSPSAYVYYDFDLEVFTIQGSLGHSIPLADAASLDLGATLGYATGDDIDDYLYYGVTADVAYTINDYSSVSIGARFSGNDSDGASTEFLWWGVSYASGF